jgi:hypothetical protein
MVEFAVNVWGHLNLECEQVNFNTYAIIWRVRQPKGVKKNNDRFCAILASILAP